MGVLRKKVPRLHSLEPLPKKRHMLHLTNPGSQLL